MADKVFAAERTRQAIAAAESGDIGDARTLLAEALTLDPEYELAWLWFAAITEDDGEKRFCLQRAQKLNPHQASPALLGLTGIAATSPPEIMAMVDPPPPKFVSGYAADLRSRRRRRLLVRWIGAVVALCLLVGLAAVVVSVRENPVYLAVVVGDNNSGPDSGQQIIQAATWAVDSWDEANPTADHEFRVVTFFDHDDPEQARTIASQIVSDGRFIGVVGHELSETSIAAGPIYQAAGIPAITATATADEVTAGNPWFFSTVFNNTWQGRGIAAYVRTVLKEPKAIIVSTADPYGRSLRQGFTHAYATEGQIQANIVVSADPADHASDLADAADTIARIDEPGPIVVASLDPDVGPLAEGLQAAGISPQIVGSDALATTAFYDSLRNSSPTIIDNALVATPLTSGTLTGEAVSFYEDFQQEFGYYPSWSAGLAYDAVDAFAAAIDRAHIDDFSTDALPNDRSAVRDVLAGARSTATSLPVLTGSLYFTPTDSANRPVSIEDGRVTQDGSIAVESAAFQLAPYSPTAGVPLAKEIESGGAVKFERQVFTIQRVVTTGFNINEITKLDAAGQTFVADFFVWLKYTGEDRGASDVVFVNAVDPATSLGPPQRLTREQGQTYALYRVTATFKAQMEFSRFPFDEQRLPIILQHRTLPAAKMTYVPDPDNLEQSQESRLESGVDAGSTINKIPNWEADAVSFFPISVGNTATLGDPYFVAGATGITYSQMASAIDISRDVTSFLIKNLLPLILLACVTYIALWLPYKDATSRISFGVTGILTGAVMLGTVTSSLPSVDYSVAIEWAYYAFIALSACGVLVTLIGRNLSDQRRLGAVRVLDRIARIAYPVVVVAVALAYVLVF